MRHLDNLTVSRKLWGLSLLIVFAISGLAAFSQHRSTRAMEAAVEDIQRKSDLITQATRWRGMTETNAQRVIVITLSAEPLIEHTFAPRLQQGIKDITVLQKQIVEAATGDADKAAITSVGQRRAVVLALTKKAAEVKQAGDAAATQAFVDNELMPAIAAYLASIDAFVKVQDDQREASKDAAREARRQVALFTLATLTVLVLAALLLTLVLVRSISRPLARAVELSEAIAAGDLTREVDDPRRDELGQLLRAMGAMARRLRAVVGEVRGGVESVSTAASEIAMGNLDLSQRTEEQASNLEQTAASMEEIATTGQHNADNARAAASYATSASDVATQGRDVVGRAVSSMDAITANSRKIAEIISVIDGIAFQTNILALNAAVEAARAGEQGRGFAVVASEVRALAQRSAQAAKEIKQLIDMSVQQVNDGSSLVHEAGRTMGDIVAQVRRVTDLVSEISAASAEQSTGIGQVGTAVSRLDQVTQQNAALVEEAAAAAQSMKDQAKRLAEVVAVFKVGTG